MEYLYNLVLLFFLYSFLGWIIEVTLKYRQYHRFINRGFLIGPYCPIYGSGVVIATFLNDMFAPLESSFGTSFLISFVFCGLLEYMTSYFFEKKYHARWWDYSQKPMNLNGRVWIGNLVLFGLAGMIITRILNPIFFAFIDTLNPITIYIVSGTLSVVFLSDYIFSRFIMSLLKKVVENSEADSSEAISKEVRELLKNKNLLYSRIIDAYPNVQFRTKKVKERLEKIIKEGENIHLMAEEKINEFNEQVKKSKEIASKNLTLTRNLQKNIIDNQSKLIELLMNGNLTDEEKNELLEKIEEDKKILEKRIVI